MIYYILQVVAFQLIFLMVYDVFLKRETFFNYNRFYLLATSIISFFIPFIKLDILKVIAPQDFVVRLPEVIIGNINTPQKLINVEGLNSTTSAVTSLSVWMIVFVLGIIISALLFGYKFYKIQHLKAHNPKRWRGNILIVKLLKSSAAFSFFNTVFLGEKIAKADKQTILKHEIIHVKQLHSLDLLLFEVLRIIMWFNPLIYIFQNRIKTLHEYIADETAVKQNGKKDYYQQLLNQIFETKTISFTNTFFKKSLIKNRIVMLQKSKSKKVNLLKYALMIPVVFTMLFYVSCDTEAGNENSKDLSKYTYSLSMNNSGMSSETQKVHDRYEEFLKSNNDYVSWATKYKDSDVIKYTVHPKNELIPQGYEETEITGADGRSYKSFMNFGYFNSGYTKIVTEVEEIRSSDYDGKSEVPFSIIEQIPTLANCGDLATKAEQKACVSREISSYVNKNFNLELGKTLGLEGKIKIYTTFKIDKNGNVVEVRSRAPHPELETEAKRVIEQLPKFNPGKQRGENVIVGYSLPIVFQVKE